MPSFAKMLHHHLPAWAILKPRLKSFVLACTGKGKSRSPTTVPQDSEQTYKTRSDIHLEERPHSHGLKSGEPDMESLGSVQHDIGGATLETFDDDRVLLEAWLWARRLLWLAFYNGWGSVRVILWQHLTQQSIRRVYCTTEGPCNRVYECYNATGPRLHVKLSLD